MTKYREIIRLSGLGLSQTNIALSCNASKTTVNKVLKAAREQNFSWPLDPKLTDPVLGRLLFPDSKAKPATSANSHFLRTAGPHFPDSQGHIKRTVRGNSRAGVSRPC